MTTAWIEALGSETRFYHVNGIRTRVIEAGSGPAIIFMHGSGGHAEAFIRNIVPLSDKNHVIAMDYLGSGMTDYPETSPTMRQRVDHIIGLMDAMGIDKACLAGESFGGTLAFETAEAYPERVSSIITIVGGTFDFGRDAASKESFEKSVRTMISRQRAFLAAPSRETVQQRLAWLFHKPERDISEELVDIRWNIYQREPVRRALADLCDMIEAGLDPDDKEGLVAPGVRPTAMTPQILQGVKHRTLVLWTDHNPSVPARIAELAASYIPGAQFVLMQDCGHWPQWEHPEVFNGIVAKFLSAA